MEMEGKRREEKGKRLRIQRDTIKVLRSPIL